MKERRRRHKNNGLAECQVNTESMKRLGVPFSRKHGNKQDAPGVPLAGMNCKPLKIGGIISRQTHTPK